MVSVSVRLTLKECKKGPKPEPKPWLVTVPVTLCLTLKEGKKGPNHNRNRDWSWFGPLMPYLKGRQEGAETRTETVSGHGFGYLVPYLKGRQERAETRTETVTGYDFGYS